MKEAVCPMARNFPEGLSSPNSRPGRTPPRSAKCAQKVRAIQGVRGPGGGGPPGQDRQDTPGSCGWPVCKAKAKREER